jgi:hypothetical protein
MEYHIAKLPQSANFPYGAMDSSQKLTEAKSINLSQIRRWLLVCEKQWQNKLGWLAT